MKELENIIKNSLEMEVKDRYQKFIDKLLNEIDFGTDNYNTDSFKLQLFRFDASLWDSYETMLFQNIITELFYSGLLDEVCCSLRSPMHGASADGNFFEEFVINSIRNQPNGIDVVSTQFKHTDGILKYDNEKYILEVKLNTTSTKEQVNRYKESTGLKKSVSVNGDEDINVRFSIVNIFKISTEYAKLFVQMLSIDNTVKNFNEGLINVIMELAKLESLGGEQ